MKHLIPISLLLLFPGALPLFAATSPPPDKPLHRVKVLELDYQFERAPRFQADVEQPRKDQPRLWLRLDGTLEVETKLTNKFIPELAATWRVVVKDAFAGKADDQLVQLRTELTFRHLRTHDGTIELVAFVHPDTIQMLTGEAKPTKRHIVAAALEVNGPNVIQTERHRDDLWKSVGDEAGKRWWNAWTHRVIDNAIVPLTRTPFLPLWADHYPQVEER